MPLEPWTARDATGDRDAPGQAVRERAWETELAAEGFEDFGWLRTCEVDEDEDRERVVRVLRLPDGAAVALVGRAWGAPRVELRSVAADGTVLVTWRRRPDEPDRARPPDGPAVEARTGWLHAWVGRGYASLYPDLPKAHLRQVPAAGTPAELLQAHVATVEQHGGGEPLVPFSDPADVLLTERKVLAARAGVRWQSELYQLYLAGSASLSAAVFLTLARLLIPLAIALWTWTLPMPPSLGDLGATFFGVLAGTCLVLCVLHRVFIIGLILSFALQIGLFGLLIGFQLVTGATWTTFVVAPLVGALLGLGVTRLSRRVERWVMASFTADPLPLEPAAPA